MTKVSFKVIINGQKCDLREFGFDFSLERHNYYVIYASICVFLCNFAAEMVKR